MTTEQLKILKSIVYGMDIKIGCSNDFSSLIREYENELTKIDLIVGETELLESLIDVSTDYWLRLREEDLNEADSFYKS